MKKSKKNKTLVPPTNDQLKRELNRTVYKARYRRTVRNIILTLINVAAVTVLIAMLVIPVLQMYGTSMEPTLLAGNIVVSLKFGGFETGDMIAFYYNNKILVKRVIARAGDWVNIDKDGNVFINTKPLDEPYLTEKALGTCNIELPYQVPESKLFVMGDNRATSLDSRTTEVGCISGEQIVGKIFLRIWPFDVIGFL